MSENGQIIVNTKEKAMTLRWLQMATYKDAARPVLNAIHTEDGESASADGFRLHMAPAALDDGQVTVNNGRAIAKSGGRVYPSEGVNGTFPDYKKIIPTGDPIATISFNKAFLRDLCEMPDDDSNTPNAITLEIFGPTQPMKAHNAYCSAVLMPMHLG